jgi:hypothetical protein
MVCGIKRKESRVLLCEKFFYTYPPSLLVAQSPAMRIFELSVQGFIEMAGGSAAKF